MTLLSPGRLPQVAMDVLIGNRLSRAQTRWLRKRLFSYSRRFRAILGALDTLVDIGVPAEKEVIQ